MLGRIYKLECEDGYYYMGSTKLSLVQRLVSHKNDSKKITSNVYKHINKIGWTKVKMILIKEIEVLSLKELRIEETKYINLNDIKCLNMCKSYTTPEEKTEQNNKQYKRYYERNKDMIKEKRKEYYLRKKESGSE